MDLILKYIYRFFVSLWQRKEQYLFEKRKKHYVVRWGEKSYGAPKILCFDGISKLSVGNYVSIANDVVILLGSNHKLNCITTYPYSGIDSNKTPQETNEKGDVFIGNDVWIGYRVTIVGGVKIGDGAIIGAGAVVVDNIPPYSVAVGVPAKVVKYRFGEKEIEELLKIKWWDLGFSKIKNMGDDLYGNDINNFIQKYKI